MPLRHSPFSLQKASIVVLADNWDLICYACPSPHQMGLLLESDDYLKTEGPFVHMPSSLLEDLMEVIGGRRNLTRKFLHLLITEQTQTLNLSYGTGEVHYGFEFLRRCKKLRELNLSYLSHIEPQLLMSVISNLNAIVSLDLQMTCTVDSTLKTIGDCCPSIRALNLTSTPVSDEGIFFLVGEKEEEDDGVKRCQKLQRLIITETRISWVGALSALQYFPEITDFDFDKIFQVFEHLDPKSVMMAEHPKFKLRSLFSMAPCIRGDSIDAAALLCPNAEVLSLGKPWIGNETLYKFMQFEKLRSITLVNNDGMTLDFDEGVLPFLQICGPNLENLILNNFSSVNLISLGNSCPRLKNMALCKIDNYETNGSSPLQGMFVCLTVLELWFDDRTEMTSTNTLLQLLHSSVNINNLLVKKSHGFSLPVLQDIWRTNPMKKLSRLTLDNCNELTANVLDDFLHMENALTVIRVWSCANITREHDKDFRQYINENNLNVYFEWFE